jgi:hypothetical protein
LVAAAVYLAAARRLARTAAGPWVLSVVLVIGLSFGLSEVAGQAYNVEPISRYLAVVERQGKPIAYVGLYHGQFHFLGRLTRPLAVIEAGTERAWLRRHPNGKVVQDSRALSPRVGAFDFSQPYRERNLVVWGLAPEGRVNR